ncbi:MAG: hypothetical protein MK077_03600 [Phycisphaerales bacterium]|nr:hypothetical protein [Phycisphaerales bacterium]
MKPSNLKIALLLWLGIITAACQSDHAPDDNAVVTTQAPSNRISLPSTVRANLGMTFANVERRQVEQTIRVPGAFELLPLARHEYRLALPGTVQLAVDQFDHVEEGDLLYRIRSPKWPELQHEIVEAEQAIDAAGSDILVAKANLQEMTVRLSIIHDRLRALGEAGVRNAALESESATLEAGLPKAQAKLSQAETVLANAMRARSHAVHRASVATGLSEDRLIDSKEGLPAYRDIELIDVYAVESGIVEQITLTDGSYEEPPTLVLSTIQPEKVRLSASIMQSDLPRIADSSSGRITPAQISTIDPNTNVNAVLTIGLAADPSHRTVPILAVPSLHQSWMRPGVSAFLELQEQGSSVMTLAIPRVAVVKDGMQSVFFRRDPKDPNVVIRVEADLGADDGRWVAVNSGLAPGDEVVLNGAYELNLANQTSGVVQKGGHFHADGTYHTDHD